MARDKIHLINQLPHIYEIEDMMRFCEKYNHVYICGAAENQEYLLKYFDSCDVRIDGYTVTKPEEQVLSHYRIAPIVAIDEVIRQGDTGVILALADKYYRYFIPKFRKAGFADYFVMTEYNKNTIAQQMKRRPAEVMGFEVNLADHCNISCQMCDHYSQLSDERFVDMDVFIRDMKQMGKIYDHKIACITLLGGEPTLHRELIRCCEITRSEFPDAQIIILTNGLLLLKLENAHGGNLWQTCKDLNINITVTVYPLKFDYAAIEKKAAEYGVSIGLSSDIHADILTKNVKITDKHTFDISGIAPKGNCVSCLYFNKFNVLKDGRFYMCPISAHIGIFNKAFNQDLRLTDADSLDIFKIKNTGEIAEFTSRFVPFCGYCDLKKWGPHSQWKPSTNSIEEYV